MSQPRGTSESPPASDLNLPHLVVILLAEYQGVVVPPSQPEMIVGSSDTVDLVLDNPYVSRLHALITVATSGLVIIRDLNSTESQSSWLSARTAPMAAR
jgi:pSer/pThr/pTyr-binding forkhead associated (FHA) protein